MISDGYRLVLSSLMTVLLFLAVTGPLAMAADIGGLSRGQTIYLPVYSYIYYGDKERTFDLAVTLSLRNTDSTAPITILSAAYHDHQGALIKQFVTKPVVLAPLAATRFWVAESDPAGGSGASLLVKWQSETDVNPPLVQAIMIGTVSNQGISFTCEGRPIQDLTTKP